MGVINIYNDEDNRTYQVNFDLKTGLVIESQTTTPGVVDYWLEVYTNIPKADGTRFTRSIVRSLSDIPPSEVTPATDLAELVAMWVEYFMTQAELAQSSSSTSSSSDSSLSSSSLSSSSLSSLSSSSSSSSSTSSTSSEGYS